MNTLYDILGVKKDATAAEITQAKRRLARANHPDRGGKTERMALINRAADVLEDSDKRAHYDATGQENIPNKDDDAWQCFVQVLAQVMANPDLAVYQILGATRQQIAGLEEVAIKNRNAIDQNIAKFERRLKKSRYKGARMNMIENITQNQIDTLSQQRANFAASLQSKVFKRALQLADEYEALDEKTQAETLRYYSIGFGDFSGTGGGT